MYTIGSRKPLRTCGSFFDNLKQHPQASVASGLAGSAPLRELTGPTGPAPLPPFRTVSARFIHRFPPRFPPLKTVFTVSAQKNRRTKGARYSSTLHQIPAAPAAVFSKKFVDFVLPLLEVQSFADVRAQSWQHEHRDLHAPIGCRHPPPAFGAFGNLRRLRGP